jgi:hypothetical protein
MSTGAAISDEAIRVRAAALGKKLHAKNGLQRAGALIGRL